MMKWFVGSLLVLLSACGRPVSQLEASNSSPNPTPKPEKEITGSWYPGSDPNPFVHQGSNATLAQVHEVYRIEKDRIIVSKQCDYLVTYVGEMPGSGNLKASVTVPIIIDRAKKEIEIREAKATRTTGAHSRYCEVSVDKGEYSFRLSNLNVADAQGFFTGLQLVDKNTGKQSHFIKVAPR